MSERQYRYKGRVFGRLIVTWCRNGAGAPFIDDAWTHDREGRIYTSKAISLVRKRNRHGERVPGRALVIGWRTGAAASSGDTETAT